MLRLSNLADYAVVIMATAARTPAGRLSATSIAQSTGVPAPTAAKLLGTLARVGLLESARGVAGGYALARAPEAISLADVVEAVEGPIALTQCSDSESGCAMEKRCDVRPHLSIINSTVRSALAQVSLADTARPAPAPAPAQVI